MAASDAEVQPADHGRTEMLEVWPPRLMRTTAESCDGAAQARRPAQVGVGAQGQGHRARGLGAGQGLGLDRADLEGGGGGDDGLGVLLGRRGLVQGQHADVLDDGLGHDLLDRSALAFADALRLAGLEDVDAVARQDEAADRGLEVTGTAMARLPGPRTTDR